jgi:hypothetical protein
MAPPVRPSSSVFRIPGSCMVRNRELTPLTLVEGAPSSDALTLTEGAISFVVPGRYEVLLAVHWDSDNRSGTRFAHSRIPDSQPLHSEAIPAEVLAALSDGRQLLRGNGLFGPGGPDTIRLEVWQDSGRPIAVQSASLTVRELMVPWPPTLEASDGSSSSPITPARNIADSSGEACPFEKTRWSFVGRSGRSQS